MLEGLRGPATASWGQWVAGRRPGVKPSTAPALDVVDAWQLARPGRVDLSAKLLHRFGLCRSDFYGPRSSFVPAGWTSGGACREARIEAAPYRGSAGARIGAPMARADPIR